MGHFIYGETIQAKRRKLKKGKAINRGSKVQGLRHTMYIKGAEPY